MDLNTKTRPSRDSDLLSGSEPYVIECFPRQNGITPAQVHSLMKRYGSRRTVLERVIKQINGAKTPSTR